MFNVNYLSKIVMICLGLTFWVSPASFAEDAQKKSQPATEQKEADVQYTGVYQDRQLIPNIMAIHCKMNAEDVAKDLNKMEDCLRQYIKEMNNEDANVAQEGRKDYETMVYSLLNDLLSTSLTKTSAADGFEISMKEYVDATNDKTDTKLSTETALTDTLAFSTDIKNHLRDLYVEAIKYEVVKNIGVITPDVFEEEVTEKKKEETEEKPANEDKGKAATQDDKDKGAADNKKTAETPQTDTPSGNTTDEKTEEPKQEETQPAKSTEDLAHEAMDAKYDSSGIMIAGRNGPTFRYTNAINEDYNKRDVNGINQKRQVAKDALDFMQSLPPEQQQTEYIQGLIKAQQEVIATADKALKRMEEDAWMYQQ